MTDFVGVLVVMLVVTMQAFMLVSFVVWVAGFVTAVAYGFMSRWVIAVCAAVLTVIGYLAVK